MPVINMGIATSIITNAMRARALSNSMILPHFQFLQSEIKVWEDENARA